MSKTYSEKLKDPRWQKKRLKILERDEWTCQLCGDDTETLHVHHKYYREKKEPWECGDFALVTVCHNCHKSEEYEKSRNEKDFVIQFYNSGAISSRDLKNLADDLMDSEMSFSDLAAYMSAQKMLTQEKYKNG